MKNNYVFFCERCSYKKLLGENPEEAEGLIPLKISKIQRHIPKLESGKIVLDDSIQLMPKYKCPKCGFCVAVKKSPS